MLVGWGLRRLPAGFADPLSGRPGKGPRGTTTPPSGRTKRRSFLRGVESDDDLPGATANRRGGRSVSAPEERTTRTAQAGRPPPPGLARGRGTEEGSHPGANPLAGTGRCALLETRVAMTG